MVFRPLVIAVAATLLSGSGVAQSGNSMLENGKASVPATLQADKPEDQVQITPELRGDIFMAKKQYREAIDAFREGSPKSAVLWNKMGIAYHQMTQIDSALKNYQQAVKLKKDY